MHVSLLKRFGIPVFSVLLMLLFSGFVQLGGVTPAQAAETVTLPAQTVAPGEATLNVNLVLPAGCKLNQEAPSTFNLKAKDGKVLAVEEKYAQNQPLANLPLSLKVPVKAGKTTLEAQFRINYCDEKIGICYFKEAILNLPVTVDKKGGKKKLEMVYNVPAK